ncbi:T9SS type A sorting domain-containing protein [Panacibacter ginsenosidivorans]|uniref:T9SS type A sorting domain-containing protein n=1 Tax=Panacibacter ginsenosidivorans TaxID=1813871 RepID=A0A5B8V661_9BACT|nr:multicopper oxidase domain-containing protein [Panacibacter ginsenosidivorans]QEC66920.1 T9SS type A sorting domain-containing protein [Panacibacter ginsenosidivorans]
MKTLSVSWFAYVFAFAFLQFSNTNNNEAAVKKVLAYKQQNTISCGANKTSLTSNGYTFTYLPFTGWNYNVTAPESGFNTLFIPDTLSGTNFTLRIHDSTKQYLSGLATATSAYNNNDILGPTLIFNKGTTVQMHVRNELQDSTTVHWHGIHLPAIMDGGPHQVIAPGALWEPKWVVKNNAATYWYHPHLHQKTSQQLIQGLGGMIIVRDDKESTLNLPRTYGVDDIPLILNDKRFEAVSNQFVMSRYGDTMMCNGTLNAQFNIPAQVVRFRLLNAAPDRAYNIGFSDNRSFSVIGGDAGLLNSPVALTRYIMSPGERIEILLDFSGQINQAVTLRAFNSELPSDISGSDPDNAKTADFVRNALGARDFDILKLNIAGATANAVTAMPATLITNETIDSTQATVTRTIKITQAGLACPDPTTKCAWFNKQFFDMNRIDYKVKQDATEIWEITNNALTSHPFHIHDVSFKILSKSNGPVEAYEKGWKDVILIRKGTTVRFIAKFSDYADSSHPYMYHCHVSFHEDEGMMGQFVVMPPAPALPTITVINKSTTEGNTGVAPMNFTVTLSAPSTQTITVNYLTKDVTALAPGDYVAASGVLTFAPGETIKAIPVTINGDTSPESNETFKLLLKKPANATLAVTAAKGTIINDDAAFASAISNSLLIDKTGIQTYPNPVVNGILSIKIPLIFKDQLQLIIADVTGTVVKTQKINSGTANIQVEVNNLISGMYFFTLQSNKNVVYKQQVEILQSN